MGRFEIDEAVVFGLTHLRRAEVFLTGLEGDVPSGDDLAEAFGCVWLALRFADTWPEEVRDGAADVIVAMLRHGNYHETARRMSAEEVRRFVTLVREVIDRADAKRGGEAVKSIQRRAAVGFVAEPKQVAADLTGGLVSHPTDGLIDRAIAEDFRRERLGPGSQAGRPRIGVEHG